MYSVTISLLILAVAVTALLFGPGIAIRASRSIRERLRARAARSAMMLDYIRTTCVFMEGLPLFFSQTWNWGPSVPNYAAGGSFPDEGLAVAPEMQSVKAAVGEALAFYINHSRKQGRPYPSEQEAISRFSEIQLRFWNSLREFVKREWPLRWRGVIREMRRLRLPDSERKRILSLKSPGR